MKYILLLGIGFGIITRSVWGMYGDDWLSESPFQAMAGEWISDYQPVCGYNCSEKVDEWFAQVMKHRKKNKMDLHQPIIFQCSHGVINSHPLLISSSSENFLRITKRLLRNHADPNIIDRSNGSGNFPLFLAVDGAPRTVKSLLRAGADPNLTNADGNPILHLICLRLRLQSPKPNYQEYVNKQIKIVKLLLHYGAEPNMRDINGRIALFHIYDHLRDVNKVPLSLVNDYVQPIIVLFLLYGADLNLRDNRGYDLVAFAQKKGQTRAAQFLKDWQEGKIKLQKKKLR